jgi:hypothetical protein
MPVTKLLRAGPVLAQPSWLGWVQPVPEIKKKEYVGPSLTQPFWADICPFVSGSVLGLVIWASLAHMF